MRKWLWIKIPGRGNGTVKDSDVFGVCDSLVWLKPWVCGTEKEVVGEMKWWWWDSNAREATENNQGAIGSWELLVQRTDMITLVLGTITLVRWEERWTWKKGAAGGKIREEAALRVQGESWWWEPRLTWGGGNGKDPEVGWDLAIEGRVITLWFYKNGLCNQNMRVRSPVMPFPNLWIWICYLIILSLSFLICTHGIIAVKTMKLGGLW